MVQTYDIGDPNLGDTILDDVAREEQSRKSARGLIGQWDRGFLTTRELRDALTFVLESAGRPVERSMGVEVRMPDGTRHTYTARTSGDVSDSEWRKRVVSGALARYGMMSRVWTGDITRSVIA